MNVNIEIRIKMDNGKEVTLKEDEAKELFLKLKEIYEKDKVTEYVPYYPYVPPVIYPTIPKIWDQIWYTTCSTWDSPEGTCKITCNS